MTNRKTGYYIVKLPDTYEDSFEVAYWREDFNGWFLIGQMDLINEDTWIRDNNYPLFVYVSENPIKLGEDVI